MKIWLDDLRPAPDGWIHAHSVNEFKAFIKTQGIPEEVSLDHDLGDFSHDGGDGWKATLWLCEKEIWPERVVVHSANAVGRSRMLADMEYYGPYHKTGWNELTRD